MSGCQPYLVPGVSSDQADSVGGLFCRASESRALALRVEGEIYLRDTLVWPDTDRLAFLRAERVATESCACLTQPPHQP